MAEEYKQLALDRIFEEFLPKSKIFKNREVLQTTYIPEVLLHREAQIRELTRKLLPTLEGRPCSNILLSGNVGTGKCTVILHVLKQLVTECQKKGWKSPLKAVINCKDSNTDYRVFAQLAAAVGEEVPNTGLPTEEVFKRFKDHLDTERQTMIVVLDEIDQLIKKPTTESSPTLLHRLTSINTELQKAQVCLIGIMNNLKPGEYLSTHLLSILAGEKIVFHPYQAAEIREILQQRAALAFYAEAIDSSALEHTMVLATQPYGDACVAINLLRVAGELAEKESAKKVTKMHVQHAQSLLEQEAFLVALKTLSHQSKLVLYSIYLLKTNNLTEISTGDVIDAYIQLCKALDNDPLTSRHVSNLIGDLEALELINAPIISRGIFGRTRQIKIRIPEGVLASFLEDNDLIKKLKGFPLKHGI